MRKILDWLNAEDVSNQMGGGCLVSAFRYLVVIGITIIIITSLIFNN